MRERERERERKRADKGCSCALKTSIHSFWQHLSYYTYECLQVCYENKFKRKVYPMEWEGQWLPFEWMILCKKHVKTFLRFSHVKYK